MQANSTEFLLQTDSDYLRPKKADKSQLDEFQCTHLRMLTKKRLRKADTSEYISDVHVMKKEKSSQAS